MRRITVFIVLVFGLAAVALVIVWYQHVHRADSAKTLTRTSAVTYKKACDLFTLKDAAAVLGQGAKMTPSHTDAVSAQKSLTTCLYSYDPGSFSDLVSATILLQGSTAAKAKQSFADARSGVAQDLSGYGEAAYWDPDLGQLNILKGQYWLIISAGSGTPNQRDQDLPRKLADIIMKRL